MGDSSSPIVGYRYRFGVHLLLGHTIDRILQIRVGGRNAWKGDIQRTNSDSGYAGIAATTVSSSPPPDTLVDGDTRMQERYDRIVIDVDTGNFKVVEGNPAPPSGHAGGDTVAVVPEVPRLAVSVATLFWGVESAVGGGDERSPVEIDNTARVEAHFESASDCQVTQAGDESFDISDGAVVFGRFQSLYINKSGLFGGIEREGGIVGQVDVAFGGPEQLPNDYLQSQLGEVPAFRGLSALILRQVEQGTAARFKPWWILEERSPNGWPGAPSSMIGNDANAAHIIFEAITNQDWGAEWSDASIDTASFDEAAQTLIDEDFGISPFWQENMKIEDFIDDVLRYIDGSRYLDPNTGLWRLKLHRDDYNIADLPVWDEDTVVEVHKFSRPGWGELKNEITVVYTDGEGEDASWEEQSITEQNQAAIRAQGGRVVSQQLRFTAITRGDVANRVLSREVHQRSQPLAKVDLTLRADIQDVRPGDVRVWSDSRYGVEQLVVRVAEVDYGTVADGRIRVQCIEDAFASRDAVFGAPTPTDWIDPTSEPAPAPARRLTEATYYQIARALSDNSASIADVPDEAGYLTTQAIRPSGDARGYGVRVDAGGGYTNGGRGEFTPTCELASAVTAGTRALPFDPGTADDLELVDRDTYAFLGDEIIAVRAVDTAGGKIIADRGAIDTVPQPHSNGTRIYFGQDFESQSTTEYAAGEQIDVKLLPATSLGRLAIADAPADTLTFDQRFIRPYPPGNVLLGGESYPPELYSPLVVTWAHRDRTQQTGPFIAQDAGDIGPEPGTTYTLRVIDRDTSQQLVEHTGLTGTTYDDSDGAETATPTSAPVSIRVEIDTERDGYQSWQSHRIDTERRGYGFVYTDDQGATNYGGFASV